MTLIDQFLNQQSETAVDRFSMLHDADLLEPENRHYRDLIPLSQPQAGQQYAFEVDLDLCSGCKACVTACHSLNGLDADETWRSVGLVHREVTGRFVPKFNIRSIKFEPTAELDLQTTPACEIPGFDEPEVQMLQQHVTTACHHCVEPGCMLGCPVKAYEKDPVTGIVRHLDDQCIGCQYCVLMCPYEVPQFNDSLGIVRKCDMCSSRLAVGQAPACVQSCPTDAIRITVVDIETIKAESAHYVQNVAGAPDSSHTYPTTHFKSSRNVSDGMQAIDRYDFKPQHPEWPLLLMLVLTQLSVGFFGAEFFVDLSGAQFSPFSPYLATAGLVAGMLGLGAAIFHLGRPHLAFRSFLGLRTSWLSRETVAGGAYMGIATLYVLLLWLAPADNALFGAVTVATQGGVLLLGGIFVFCSMMVYKSTPRVFWNGSQPIVRFLSTVLILGSAGSILVCVLLTVLQEPVSLPTVVSHIVTPLALLLTLVSIAKLFYENRIYRHLKDESLTPQRRTGLLMRGIFLEISQARIILGILSSVMIAPGLIVSSASASAAIFFSVTLFLVCLIAEGIERYLFFRCSVSPKMPGISSSSRSLYWWMEEYR